MKVKQKKTYLMISGSYKIKRVTSEQIQQEVRKGNQAFTLVDGVVLKSEETPVEL
jgi:hypothetical protein